MNRPARALHCLLMAAAIVAPALVVTSPVQAFTIDDKGNTSSSSSGGARLTDPVPTDSRFGSSTSDGTYRSGNFSLQFNSRGSFDQRYDSNRMFDPIGRPGSPR